MRRRAALLATLGLTLAAGAAGAPAALAQETTPPVTTATLDPADPGPGGIYDGPVDVTLSATDPDEGGPDPETVEVAAQGFIWNPDEVEITVGDTVEWDFSGGFHDICLDTAAPEGPVGATDCGDDELVADDTEEGGSKTFTEPGTVPFYCSIHYPGMEGTVDVAEGGGTPGSGVDITEYRVNTDGVDGEWQTSENTGPTDPFETTFAVPDVGDHVVEYRSTDNDGNVELNGSVEFSIETAPGEPDVALGVTPRSKRGKVNKPAAFTARLTNDGGPATEVKVCVKAKSRLVKVTGGRCWWLDELAGGAARTTKFTFKPKRAARGKSVRLQFKTTHAGGPPQMTTATLKVAR